MAAHNIFGDISFLCSIKEESMKIGFDNDLYLQKQTKHIEERIAEFGGKLYLEFGGKLFDDYHASRVLPGFAPDTKMQVLKKLSDKAEVVIVINANDIEEGKIRADLNITYDQDVLRLIDAFREFGVYVGSVCITHFTGQTAATGFKAKLQSLGVPVFMHYPIEGYPSDIDRVISDEGYGKNEYIETTRPLVVVTAPGPGSGKMATCLSQLYHEHKRGIDAGYVKYETFPVWNLPLKHPVNLAYEAATANLNDINMIDPYHLEAYGKVTINYNRDVEIFPVLSTMFEKLMNKNPYKSPTDMGVNMAGFGIIDDEVCREAAKAEIVRRYYHSLCGVKSGIFSPECVDKIQILMKQAGISTSDRKVVQAALSRSEETAAPAVSIELDDGRIITGKTSPLLGACSAALLNAIKALAGIPKETLLISPKVIAPIHDLKVKVLGGHNPRLHSDETLIALAMSSTENADAKLAYDQLKKLKSVEAHSSVLLAQVDLDVYRKLGINLTCEPRYQTKKLYHK